MVFNVLLYFVNPAAKSVQNGNPGTTNGSHDIRGNKTYKNNGREEPSLLFSFNVPPSRLHNGVS